MALITFRDLTLGYDRHPAVHHLSGTLQPGSLTAVVGPNGAGKSTLFRGIVGLLKPLAGEIVRDGIRAHDIAYLPQIAEVDRSFPITLFDFVSAGLWSRSGAFGAIRAADRLQVRDAIAALGLQGFERRPIGTLSGGQMQRMLFARLLLQDAKLIVLDEPFNAIDARTTADLLALIGRWHREGRTIVAALHDYAMVTAQFPETLLLAREVVAWGPTATVMTESNLAAARRMSEAFDDEAGICVYQAPPNAA